MTKKLRVGVVFGGRSAEHDVSLQSARNVIAAMDPRKYEVVPIAIRPDGRWRAGVFPPGSPPNLKCVGLPREGIEVIPAGHPSAAGLLVPLKSGDRRHRLGRLDVVFPVLHGTFGEDGTVQGLFELAGIAYVGAGVLGSAAGMDKDVMKRLFRERGLPIAPYLAVRRKQIDENLPALCRRITKELPFPMFVKPANLGSSVGVSKARNATELSAALRLAASYDTKILVEKAIQGREIECAVLGNDEPAASVPGEVIPAGEFYDYAAKYEEDTARLVVPAPLTTAQVKRVQQLAVAAFQAVECAGMGRVDLFLEKKTGRFLLNEINTIPGFTAISMYPRLWEASGLPYPRLIDRLIELALERHREKLRTRYSRSPARASQETPRRLRTARIS
ncbi:MAG TPA: D-alanine--D-alanine ligase family protein [Terriglobia bacterium]|nr:D-alanine--D-alanine ligase family protein [Terriglobia bacterium]